MISSNDLRRGTAIKLDGKLFVVVEAQHVKPGKGPAFMRSKIKNIEKGATVERTFRAGEKLEDVYIDSREAQFSYYDGGNYVFMDLNDYEQVPIPADTMGEDAKYLHEGMEITIDFVDGKPININLPIHVTYELTECQPGLKGDTVSGATKPAVCQNGLRVQVPLFLKQGEKIKVDTRTGEYIERI